MTIGSKSVTLTFPQISFAVLADYSEKVRQNFNDLSSSSMNSMRNSQGNMKKVFKHKYFVPGLVIAVLLIVIGFLATRPSTQATSTTSSEARPSVEKPLAIQTINKTYTYPIKDTAGKKVKKFK